MTTALSIITDAGIEIGIVATGQRVGTEDSSLMLRKLNQRLQSWSNLRLLLPTLTEVSVPLTGAQSYTIGPTGVVATTRPLKVESATAVDANSVEYPVDVLTNEQWHSVAVKAYDGGPPNGVWYDAQNTNGRLYVVPKASGYTLKLQCLSLLSSFATLSTDCALPDGYELALVLTLAEDTAGAFGRPITPDLRMRAKGARDVLKRTNAEPVYLSIDFGGQPFQIERGY